MSKLDDAMRWLERNPEHGDVILDEITRLRARVAELEPIVLTAINLSEHGMGVEFDDERLDYVTIQVDRNALAAFKSAIAAHDEAKRQPAAAAIPAETEQQKWDRVHWGGEEP